MSTPIQNQTPSTPNPYTEREMVAFVADPTPPSAPSAKTIPRGYDITLFGLDGVGQAQHGRSMFDVSDVGSYREAA